MPRGEKGRHFKPGQTGNPNGRPRVPEDIKEARKFDRIEMERLMNKFLNMKPVDLITQVKSGDLTCKEMLIASVINKGIVHGDQHRLDFILNRMIGKVTNIVLTIPPERELEDMSDEELDEQDLTKL